MYAIVFIYTKVPKERLTCAITLHSEITQFLSFLQNSEHLCTQILYSEQTIVL